MKFTEAWASVAQQNLNLKRVTITFAFLCLCLSVMCLRLLFRDEIIFERSCFTKALKPVDSKHSPQEIESFLKDALIQRFNSINQSNGSFLSQNELQSKNQEQRELSQRSMNQTIIVRSVKEENGSFLIDSDRLIAVGNVRSAFRFPLRVILSSQARSMDNPYGLLVTSIESIEKETK